MTIHELIQRSGFSRRTIYYYTQLGLLPAPRGKGKNFQYTEEHLQRLLYIKKLQNARYSLKEIQTLINRQEPEEISRLAETKYFLAIPAGSAADIPEFEERIKKVFPRSYAVRVQLAEGLELYVQWPLTARARKFLEKNLPEILTILEG